MLNKVKKNMKLQWIQSINLKVETKLKKSYGLAMTNQMENI